SLSTNLTSCYVPKKWKNFKWVNTIGITWTNRLDSINGAQQRTDLINKLALLSAITINFPKIKSVFEGSYRKIPSAYDGFSQGIYLNQTEQVEVVYKQSISRNLKLTTRYSRNSFRLVNNVNSFRLINQL